MKKFIGIATVIGAAAASMGACGQGGTCERLAEEDAKCEEIANLPAFHMCVDDAQQPPSSECVPLGESGDYCCPEEGNSDGVPTAGPGLDPEVEPVANTGYGLAASTTWQWQLDGPLNTNYAVDLYDVDLFDTAESMTATLHALGRYVVCYFSAGSAEDWRSDYAAFPETALGLALDGWAGERWADVTDEAVLAVMTARLDLALEKGCDGVELDNVDGYDNQSGFQLTFAHQLGYNRRLANEAHQRGLTVLLKNDLGQINDLLAYFDGALNEECFSYNECDKSTPFTLAGKPVFQVEYADDVNSAAALGDAICTEARALGFHTLILPWNLDDSFRVSCDE